MSYYGYEYFCGANVTVRIGDVPLLEAAGISYELSSTKRPLWGYSSIHFDAVGRGQDIIQGTLIVNFVHKDYLFRVLQASKNITADIRESRDAFPSTDIGRLQGSIIDNIIDEGGATSMDGFINSKRRQFWIEPPGSSISPLHNTENAVEWSSSTSISIVFGEQGFGDQNHHGQTGVFLEAVHFTGQSSVIRIDEETIVEVYPFFARNCHSLRKPYQITAELVDFDKLLAETKPTY